MYGNLIQKLGCIRTPYLRRVHSPTCTEAYERISACGHGKVTDTQASNSHTNYTKETMQRMALRHWHTRLQALLTILHSCTQKCLRVRIRHDP